MNRKDCLAAYKDFSAQTSDNVRKLGFAGIGAIWVFRTQTATTSLSLPPMLVWSGFAIVLALLLDFLQYAYATIAWGSLHRAKERANVSLMDEFKAPSAINWPTITLFWFKVSSVAVAYVILLVFLARSFPLSYPSATRMDWWVSFWMACTAIATVGLVGVAGIAAAIANSQLRQSAIATRASAELDALWHFDDQWEPLRATRCKAAGLFLDNAPYAEDERTDLLDFFELLAYLTNRNTISDETTWIAFYWYLACYWTFAQDHICNAQQQEGPTWDEITSLMPRLRGIEAAKSKRPLERISPSAEEAREFLEKERSFTD